jgi:hypothetical protein
MTKVLKQEQTIKIGREPMVLLPLKKWEEIRELIEDFEDAARFQIAFDESRKEKKIDLKALGKKYSL